MKEKKQQWRNNDGRQAQVRLTICHAVQVVPLQAA